MYLSTDATLGAGDTPSSGSTTARTTALAGGTSYTVSKSATVPLAAPGSYYLIVNADSANAIVEPNETDNTKAVPFQVLAPDLVASSLVAPPTIANGDRVVLSWTVDNIGSAIASGTWTDKVYLSSDTTWDVADTYVGQVTRTNTSLAAGTSYAVSTTFQFPKSYAEGPAYLIVAADNNANIFEASEANNYRALSVTMTRADFVVDAFTTQSSAPGELVPMSWTVRNAGTGTAHGQWNTSGTDTYRWYDRVISRRMARGTSATSTSAR